MNRLAVCRLLPGLMLFASSAAWSLGLGELRGQVVLGEGVAVTVDLLGVERQPPDASCFRLAPPDSAGDIPWLKRASFNVRPGVPAVLEIRSAVPLREPVLQIALQVVCGHELKREYVLLASPGKEPAVRPVEPRLADAQPVESRPPQPERRSRAQAPLAGEAPQKLAPPPRRKTEVPQRALSVVLPDRLLLSDGGEVGEPSLRLATELGTPGGEAKEIQRDMLRLEFRMLMAMQEQATTQLETAEKLRKMEETLGELKQKAGDFAMRAEQGGQAERPALAAPAPLPVPQQPATVEEEGWATWSMYAALAGAVLGLAGWFGWRSRRGVRSEDSDASLYVPPLKIDPQRDNESDAGLDIDLAFEPQLNAGAMAVDVELDGAGAGAVAAVEPQPPARPAVAPDSIMSIHATTVDEHFEANPVMELADIMLSFGRVKGAAQALQEYIDNNPQEALQPWIRLMEVYRMAGMRQEFEEVARNLNRHFNIAVQPWESPPEAEVTEDTRPAGLDEIPRLMGTVVDLWPGGDVVGYLYQLLRDNRGGGRQGFTMPVVDDILFLIELKETANRMDVALQ